VPGLQACITTSDLCFIFLSRKDMKKSFRSGETMLVEKFTAVDQILTSKRRFYWEENVFSSNWGPVVGGLQIN
jgi:uncharacterized protein involved in tolerance to divalent cations